MAFRIEYQTPDENIDDDDTDIFLPAHYDAITDDYRIDTRDIEAYRFVKDTPFNKLQQVSTRKSVVIIPDTPNDIVKFLDTVSRFLIYLHIPYDKVPYLKISDVLVNKENGGIAVYFKLDHRSEPNTFFKYQSDLQDVTDLTQLKDKWLETIQKNINDPITIDPKTQTYAHTCCALIRPLLVMIWPFDVGTDFSLVYNTISYPKVYQFVESFNSFITDAHESELFKSYFEVAIRSNYNKTETGEYSEFPSIELCAQFKVDKTYSKHTDFRFKSTFDPMLKIDLNRHDILFLSHIANYDTPFEFDDKETMECTDYDFKLLKAISNAVELSINADKSSDIRVFISKNDLL